MDTHRYLPRWRSPFFRLQLNPFRVAEDPDCEGVEQTHYSIESRTHLRAGGMEDEI